jgi:hypothetical protein
MHPALHMVTTESSECDARLGMTWATQAPAWRSGRLRLQVCVDCALSPLGRQTGALVVRKWLIAPELRTAHCLMVAASVLIVLRRTEAAIA